MEDIYFVLCGLLGIVFIIVREGKRVVGGFWFWLGRGVSVRFIYMWFEFFFSFL